MQRIALMAAAIAMLFAPPASAEDVDAYICADRNGSDECTASEVGDTITEDLDTPPNTLDSDGTLDRNDAPDGERRFNVYMDQVDNNNANLCRAEWVLQWDPLTLTLNGGGNLGVATASPGTEGGCNAPKFGVSPPVAPDPLWPGLTAKAHCFTSEDAWDDNPDGDLSMGLGAERRAIFQVILETGANPTAARTGPGAVVLRNVNQWHVVAGECVKDTSTTKTYAGEVKFAVEDVAGSTDCGDDDIDGDKVCEITGTGGDNCGGFNALWANPSQEDHDGDGYGNVCDTDVTGDCKTGGPDLADVFAHFGDAEGNDWDAEDPSQGSGHGEVYNVNGDTAVGGPDLTLTFANFGENIGPSYVTGADPDPACD